MKKNKIIHVGKRIKTSIENLEWKKGDAEPVVSRAGWTEYDYLMNLHSCIQKVMHHYEKMNRDILHRRVAELLEQSNSCLIAALAYEEILQKEQKNEKVS